MGSEKHNKEELHAKEAEKSSVHGPASTPNSRDVAPAQSPGLADGNDERLGKDLVDGRCLVCTGLTVFSLAHKKAKRKPDCYGFRTWLHQPPRPYTVPSELEAQAVKHNQEESLDFTFMCLGSTVQTAKMLDEGWTPIILLGLGITSTSQRKQSQSPSKAMPSSMSEDTTLVVSSETIGAYFTAVSTFWKESLSNYPEKYYRFTGKFVRRVNKTADSSARFGQRLLLYWVPSSWKGE